MSFDPEGNRNDFEYSIVEYNIDRGKREVMMMMVMVMMVMIAI